MHRVLRYLLRWQVALSAFVWLGAANLACLALAQAEEAEEEVISESWTLAYALVLVAIVFGLVLICRPILRKRDFSGGE